MCPTLLDALSGKTEALATTDDLYNRKAILVIASDLSQQHPFLAFQIRANYRHHGAHIYTVTPGPVREQKQAVRSIITVPGRELADVESLRDQLKAEPELVIVFGDAIKGDAISQAGGVRRFARHPGEVRLPGGLFEFARRIRHGAFARHLGPGYRAGRRRRAWRTTKFSRRRISTCCGWWARIR